MPDNKSSIKSSFQMVSYKIDRIEFSSDQNLQVLNFNKVLGEGDIIFSLTFRNALRFPPVEGKTTYVNGITVNIEIKNNGLHLATGSFVITGLFICEGFDKKTEESLAKYQSLSILFPYLRATITSTLANAGFGSNFLPLINVAVLAENLNISIEDSKPAEDSKPLK